MQSLVVAGNHDTGYPAAFDPADDFIKVTNNICLAPRGFCFVLGEATWLSLPGAVSVDRDQRHRRHDWVEREAMTRDDVIHAVDGGRLVDVVVSHDAPSSITVPGLGDPARWPPDVVEDADAHRGHLDQVARHVKPRLWVHGHHHRSHRTTIDLGRDARRPQHTSVMTVHGLAGENGPAETNLLFVRADGRTVPC